MYGIMSILFVPFKWMLRGVIQIISIGLFFFWWCIENTNARAITSKTSSTNVTTNMNNGTSVPQERLCIGYSSGGGVAGGFGYGTAMCNGDDISDLLNSCNCCLAGDGMVKQRSGISKKVSELESGDIVQAMSDQNPNVIIETDVIMIMHRESSKCAVFHVIETDDHQEVRMTPGHFVPVLGGDGGRHYVPVQTLTVNNYVFIWKSEGSKELTPSKVANIKIENKVGYYSILTSSGTLIVNNVAVSCYSNIRSHEIAHLGMAPLRWIHILTRRILPSIGAPFKDDGASDTIHWIPFTMQKIVRTVAPQLLTN